MMMAMVMMVMMMIVSGLTPIDRHHDGEIYRTLF
jgi:hypothetical protein